MFSVRFRLRDVEEIEPWGEPGDRSLHWFGLTDGWACIETPRGALLSSPEGERCASQVARLFEDLLGIWPSAAELVPADLLPLIADEDAVRPLLSAAQSDDDTKAEAASLALDWICARTIPFCTWPRLRP